MTDPVYLVINPSHSWCGNCGKGANPRAERHDRILCYGDESGRPGCGAVWTHVTSDYQSIDRLHVRVREMRPDLTDALDTYLDRLGVLRKGLTSA